MNDYLPVNTNGPNLDTRLIVDDNGANAEVTQIENGKGDSSVPIMIKNGGVTPPGEPQEGGAPYQVKLYRRRWVILVLFVCYSMSNAFQWIEYSIITDIIMKYYGVEPEAVEWTSMIYMVTYIPLIFPASWLLNKKGLRVAVLIGSFGTALGAWIKCASVSPDRYIVTMFGQTVTAVSQIFILGIPPRLAAVWFGPTEVSTACSIGVFGNQFGIALGFLLPPIIVPNGTDEEIGHGLNILFFTTAGLCSLIFILIIIIFKAEPPIPPSMAAAAAIENEDTSYVNSIMRLVSNKSYWLLLLSYGINVGVFYAISTLLNQVVLHYFPGENENCGRIGLTIVVSGMVGSVVCGLWLDKTHKFKQTTLAIYIFSFVGMVAYTFMFKLYIIGLVFLTAGFLGFSMTGYLPVGFEFAAEITYPESEGTSSGLLNASAQVFGILFTMAASKILKEGNDIYANCTLAGTLVIGIGMTALVKADLRRQRAQKATTTVRSPVAEVET